MKKCKHGKNIDECGFCKNYDDTQGSIDKSLLLD